jgi:3-keto-disaccharide hydrolase
VNAVATIAASALALLLWQDPDQPRVVDSGPPPSDAIVLFDGTDLSQWRSTGEGPALWSVQDGVMTVNGTGYIETVREFGDCQIHLEWATPSQISGSGQERGNSGVYLQRRYEIQILDSYENSTYPDGSAGSLYKQYAPLVNASRPPGVWQSYDIVFHAPRFDESGSLLRPATVTVVHNGVLVLDHVEVLGSTTHEGAPVYSPHPPKQPLMLQDHGCPVQFRNIWIREL